MTNLRQFVIAESRSIGSVFGAMESAETWGALGQITHIINPIKLSTLCYENIIHMARNGIPEHVGLIPLGSTTISLYDVTAILRLPMGIAQKIITAATDKQGRDR